MPAKSKLKTVGHVIAASMVLLRGVDRLETGGHVWFYFIMGALILLLAFYHEKIKIGEAVFSFIEGILVLFIGIEMFEHHKVYLPWLYLVAGSVYFYAGYRQIRKSKA